MVYQYAAHGVGGESKKVCAVLEFCPFPVQEHKEEFVHQASRFERMIGPLPAKVADCDLAQMRVHQRSQNIDGFVVALRPAIQQHRDVSGGQVQSLSGKTITESRPPPAGSRSRQSNPGSIEALASPRCAGFAAAGFPRSEEHTSELQSLRHLVCRLLL